MHRADQTGAIICAGRIDPSRISKFASHINGLVDALVVSFGAVVPATHPVSGLRLAVSGAGRSGQVPQPLPQLG
jgi:hypothetical protein